MAVIVPPGQSSSGLNPVRCPGHPCASAPLLNKNVCAIVTASPPEPASASDRSASPAYRAGATLSCKGKAQPLNSPTPTHSSNLANIARALADLVALLLAAVIVPWTPFLASTYLGAPWQATAVAAGWAAVWYVWVAAQVRATQPKSRPSDGGQE